MSVDLKVLQSFLRKYPVLIACLVISFGLGVIIYARSDMNDALSAELDQKSNEGKRYHVNIANAAQLTDELQALLDANLVVNERAVNPNDLAKNLQYFYRIESETGVKYTDLRQTGADVSVKSGPKRIYIPVNYVITVTGDFFNIISFLRSLEKGTHFYRLNSLVASGKGSSTTLNLNIDLLGQP